MKAALALLLLVVAVYNVAAAPQFGLFGPSGQAAGFGGGNAGLFGTSAFGGSTSNAAFGGLSAGSGFGQASNGFFGPQATGGGNSFGFGKK